MRLLLILLGSLLCLPAFGQVPTPPFNQCPAAGLNTSCRILIYIDKNGGQRVLTDPNQSATYDGADDTLIGVVNQSTSPVASIPLTSSTNIFGFDGDGICSSSIQPHPAACPFGPNQYEGPGVSFAAINASGTSGTVNFNPPIAANGGTAYFGLEDAIPTTCADADGDGLCDDWEKNGVTVFVNGSAVFVDLPSMGADPNHKDIFIQADYMVAGDHTHKPMLPAVALVTAAFNNAPVANPDGTTGIHLHVDCGSTCIMNPVTSATWGALSQANVLAHQTNLGTTAANNYNWAAFDVLKTANFSPARAQIFHYLVFAHNLGGLGTTSGISRGITASDFIVSLGGWPSQTGTTMQQAGTLMHELGHNLSLQHGGTDGVNYKPNFLSVMNYSFQMKGLAVNGAQSLLDYSRFGLGSLNETALNEPGGLGGGAALATYGTLFYCQGAALSTFVANANGAIDWNCNGVATDAAASTDINKDGAKTTLTTYNDWPNLVFTGGSVGGLGLFATPPPQTTVVPEVDPLLNAALLTPLSVTVTSPGLVQVVPGPSSSFVTFTVTNAGTQSDSYALTGSTSKTWVTFSGLPPSVTLAPGASASFTAILAPGVIGITIGDTADFSLKAISISNGAVQNTGTANATIVSSLTLPGSIQATAGDAQLTPVNTPFGSLLQATVTGPGNTSVAGASVTFTAPSSGVSGTFAGGSATATVSTNSLGVASAPVLTANGTAGGPYTVAAAVAGSSTVFNLTNTGVSAGVPVLTAVTPSSGSQGQTLTVNIAGTNTNFVSGGSNVAFSGTGITLNSVTVFSPNTLGASVTISVGAPLGARDVTVITGGVAATAPGAFTVTAAGTIVKITPVITWPTPAAIPSGQALDSRVLNATSNVPGTFVYTPAAGTVLAPGTFTLTAVFTPTDTTTYNAVTTTVSLTVGKKTPTITWISPGVIPFGQPLDGRILNATASVPGTFVYSAPAGTILGVGPNTLTVTFTPTDTVNFTTATASITVQVATVAVDQSITFPQIPDHVSTDAPFTISATASSGLPVSFVLFGGPATVSGNTITLTGTGRVIIQAVQPGNASFNPANPITQNFLVLGPVPAVTSVANAASNMPAPLAPGGFGTIFGTNLALQTAPVQKIPYPVQVNGVTLVLIDANGVSTPMMLYYVSPTQINFLVPMGVAKGAGTLRLSTGSGQTMTMSVTVAPVSPGLFSADGSGKGPAAAQIVMSGDQTYAVLYGTGISGGKVISVTVGGTAAKINFAGPQSQFPGLDQVNVQFPTALFGTAPLNVILTVDGVQSNTVTLAKP